VIKLTKNPITITVITGTGSSRACGSIRDLPMDKILKRTIRIRSFRANRRRRGWPYPRRFVIHGRRVRSDRPRPRRIRREGDCPSGVVVVFVFVFVIGGLG